MGNFIKIKHAFNGGDLLTLLPGLQKLYQEKGKKSIIYQNLNFPAFYYEGAYSPIVNKEGQQVCMNEEMFFRLYPLLKSQEYIEEFLVWNGESVDMDIDKTRDTRTIPMPAGLLHSYPPTIFPELNCDLSIPWLKVAQTSVKKEYYSDKIIINRTHRYTNPYISYYFLKPYEKQLLFSGTEHEHSDFCHRFNLDIPYLKSDDFLQVAQIISWCKGGIFNQSLHWHIADALKVNRILELCPQFPNTFATGANGSGFYHQSSLEYLFIELIEK